MFADFLRFVYFSLLVGQFRILISIRIVDCFLNNSKNNMKKENGLNVGKNMDGKIIY